MGSRRMNEPGWCQARCGEVRSGGFWEDPDGAQPRRSAQVSGQLRSRGRCRAAATSRGHTHAVTLQQVSVLREIHRRGPRCRGDSQGKSCPHWGERKRGLGRWAT